MMKLKSPLPTLLPQLLLPALLFSGILTGCSTMRSAAPDKLVWKKVEPRKSILDKYLPGVTLYHLDPRQASRHTIEAPTYALSFRGNTRKIQPIPRSWEGDRNPGLKQFLRSRVIPLRNEQEAAEVGKLIEFLTNIQRIDERGYEATEIPGGWEVQSKYREFEIGSQQDPASYTIQVDEKGLFLDISRGTGVAPPFQPF